MEQNGNLEKCRKCDGEGEINFEVCPRCAGQRKVKWTKNILKRDNEEMKISQKLKKNLREVAENEYYFRRMYEM